MTRQGEREASPKTMHPSLLAWLELFISKRFSQRLLELDFELPPLSELLSGLLLLAEGKRHKVLVPFVGSPLEAALVRNGQHVLFSLYHTEASPEAWIIDRPVPLTKAIEVTLDAIQAKEPSLWVELHERARKTKILKTSKAAQTIYRKGGEIEAPREEVGFGFEAKFNLSDEPSGTDLSHSDVHAMLFRGSLWAWIRKKHLLLLQDFPILLAIQRMVSAIASLIVACQEHRGLHIRLCLGPFCFGLRSHHPKAEVTLILGEKNGGLLTFPSLDPFVVSKAVLGVASELLSTLLECDRAQKRNLRILALFEEVGRMQRFLRSWKSPPCFTSAAPERFRVEEEAKAPLTQPTYRLGKKGLEFVPRWSIAIDGIDAYQLFLWRDHLIVGNAHRILALDRNQGHCLWETEGEAQSSLLTDRGLVLISASGACEIRAVDSGEVIQLFTIAASKERKREAILASGTSLPPTLLVVESDEDLVAIDLRTGVPRFRYSTRLPGKLQIRRGGRLVFAVNGDAFIDAIDVISGETVWRFATEGGVHARPARHQDRLWVVAETSNRREAILYALNAWSGEYLHTESLNGKLVGEPQVVDGHILITLEQRGQRILECRSAHQGTLLWSGPDPGIAKGGGMLGVDGLLIVNGVNGYLTALSMQSGKQCYRRALNESPEDAVPRRLAPLLRGGALFVPSSRVHVLRASDGQALGAPVPCDLVPDGLIVDERGWMYIAEESGHLMALNPRPTFEVIRGGTS
ncbi:MAG: PQQ-like beta-propeller repeat protein [Sandaracinaceae bacterium]|nr:PQQ-like beta-propeller repeat protein [Sandaracinaceae bacterium]